MQLVDVGTGVEILDGLRIMQGGFQGVGCCDGLRLDLFIEVILIGVEG